MKRFLLNFRNIKELVITGCKAFLGKMLRSYSNNILLSNEMLDQIVKYYEAAYKNQDFQKPFSKDSESAVIIRVKMN